MLAQVSFILDTSLLFVCHLPLGEEEKNKKKNTWNNYCNIQRV